MAPKSLPIAPDDAAKKRAADLCPEDRRRVCNRALVRVWRRLSARYGLDEHQILDALGPLLEAHADLTPLEEVTPHLIRDERLTFPPNEPPTRPTDPPPAKR